MKREKAVEIVRKARDAGRETLSEHESKDVLACYGIPVTREILVTGKKEVPRAAEEIGYPVVMKGCSWRVAHKTEKGLIRTDIRTAGEALAVFDEIVRAMDGDSGGVLIQQMVRGRRELVMGMTRDAQFGPCVMFGLGGIFTEILRDVVFRKAPLERRDALEMMEEIRGREILGAARGMPAADRERLAETLMQVGEIGVEIAEIREIDLNPVILAGSLPIVVDALMVLSPGKSR